MNNTGKNRTSRRISRTGIDGTIPVHSGISRTSTPYPSDNSGTRINGINKNSTPDPSGISGTSAAPPAGGLWSPRIGNIRKSTSPNTRNSNELKYDIDGKFSNDPIATPVLTQVFSEKLSNSFRRDLYRRYGVHLTTDPVNPVAPQFINHDLSTSHTLNKGARIWCPATRIRRSPDVTHWSAADHDVGQSAAVGDAVGKKSDYSEENYKPNLKFGWKIPNFNLSAKILKGVDHLWTQILLVQKLQTKKHQQ